MGIAQLWEFVKKTAPECCNTETLEDWKGKRIAIDTEHLVHKFSYKGVQGNVISQIIWLIFDLWKYDIDPIFIFDGDKNPLKENTHKHRAAQKDTVKQKIELYKNWKDEDQKIADQKLIENNDNIIEGETKPVIKDETFVFINKSADGNFQLDKKQKNEINQFKILQQKLVKDENGILKSTVVAYDVDEKIDYLKQSTIVLNYEDISLLKKILSTMGLKIIRADYEAEAICSVLNRLGYVDAIMSDDSDIFILGGKKMIRDLGGKSSRDMNQTTVRVFDIGTFLKKVGISQEQLIDLGTLLPNDYNKGENCRINGVGIMTCLPLIKEGKTAENIIDELYWLHVYMLPKLKDENLNEILLENQKNYYKKKFRLENNNNNNNDNSNQTNIILPEGSATVLLWKDDWVEKEKIYKENYEQMMTITTKSKKYFTHYNTCTPENDNYMKTVIEELEKTCEPKIEEFKSLLESKSEYMFPVEKWIAKLNKKHNGKNNIKNLIKVSKKPK